MFKRNDLTKGAILVLLFGLLAAACGRIAKPDGWASPIESGDIVLASNHDRVVAFRQDLEEVWQFPPPDADIRDTAALYGTPAIEQDKAFIPSYDRNNLGSVHGVSMDDGSVVWTFEGDDPILGSITVGDGVVYVGDNEGHLYALDASTGEEVWDSPFKADEQIWSAPALSDGTLYVTSLDGKLYALDPGSGEQLWSFETDAGIATPPIVDPESNSVYVASFDTKVYAVNRDSGEQEWTFTGANAFWSTPLLLDGTLYVADADGNVNALNTNNGKSRWDSAFQAGDAVRSAIIEIDGSIFVVDRSGDVYSLSPTDASEQATTLNLDTDVFADPLRHGDSLIVVTADGDIVQIDPQNLSIIGQRPV